ncbi:hypothetical protein LAZ67_3005932 [Cordylochernes scorpioides]|uniref:Mos1 transposase HTH domain-containing protein n=1 Tax=Cordylochernes scorpioides TaxID=51811 RepID=A0ABY6KAQ6_9ARAC|nr:hypothetical protein LAZ67_3005932 [Cordylochernes scorpioides]
MAIFEGQRICIKFCFKLKKRATETYELIEEAFGDAALSRSRTFEWFSGFQKGLEKVNDDQHTGRPRSLRCEENKLKIKALIKSNRRISIKNLSSETGLSYDPETKRQSSQWIERGEPKPKKARFTKSKVKTLLVTFFYINGLVHHEFIPFGRTINQEVYLVIMRRLREAVRLKRPERWQNNDWILHVDNARPHTVHVVLQFLAKHSTIQIPYPPYSPDLAPNDFFLYPKLKMKLKGRKFDKVDMIQAESKATLRNLSKSDFISCFDNWKNRWNRFTTKTLPAYHLARMDVRYLESIVSVLRRVDDTTSTTPSIAADLEKLDPESRNQSEGDPGFK